MVDQIREIEGRVQSLKMVLESPVGDRDSEEKVRRDALIKFVTPSDKNCHIFESQCIRGLLQTGSGYTFPRMAKYAAVWTTGVRLVISHQMAAD